jgi:hypothetical protein
MKSLLLLAFTLPLTGCLVIGYSSRGGWHVWPGSLVITLILLGLMYLLNRRR